MCFPFIKINDADFLVSGSKFQYVFEVVGFLLCMGHTYIYIYVSQGQCKETGQKQSGTYFP